MKYGTFTHPEFFNHYFKVLNYKNCKIKNQTQGHSSYNAQSFSFMAV